MDAVEFIEERCRMCNSYHYCAACPGKEGAEFCGFNVGSGVSAKEQVAIVEKWAKEHPRKTRQSVFLERYPEANVDKSTGVLVLCPAALKKEYRDDRGACNAYSIESGVCDNCRRAFRMQEVE